MENKIIFRNLLILITSIAIMNLIIDLLTQALFACGIFRDELYYLACANRIDTGYVDHPPLSIWILSVWKFFFGDSMFVTRIVPAIISSVSVFMIGLFTLRLGGNKTAIILAMVSFMLSPIFLGMNTIYSMNVFDFLFWISSSYIFLRIIQAQGQKTLAVAWNCHWLWTTEQNKQSMVVFRNCGGNTFHSIEKRIKNKIPLYYHSDCIFNFLTIYILEHHARLCPS